MPDEHWFLYMIRCADGSLYTGITTDLERRLKQHNDGDGSKYTRSRLPVTLAYVEEYMNESDVRKREAAIKKLTRPQKERLLAAVPGVAA